MSASTWILPVLGRLVACILVTWACHIVAISAMGKATEPGMTWALTIVTSAPIWVWVFLRPAGKFLEYLIDAYRAHLWRHENGRYYAFEGQRVRVLLIDDEPWVIEQDIVKIAGKGGLTRTNWHAFPPELFRSVPGTKLNAFSESGVKKLFSGRTDHQMNRIDLWLEREVFFPFRRARERGMKLPET